jgi:hypothetical protein
LIDGLRSRQDDGDELAHRHILTGLSGNMAHDAGRRGFYLRDRLIGFNFKQRLALLHRLALGHKPADNFA